MLKRKKKNWFLNLKIKEKLLFMNIGIILIMVIILGFTSYMLARKSLTASSLNSSQKLMEQLGKNLENNIQILNEFLVRETMQADLREVLTDKNSKGNKQKQQAKDFSFNLMNYNHAIQVVCLEGISGTKYVYSWDSEYQKEFNQNYPLSDKALDLNGKMYWEPYSKDLVLVSRAIYDKNTMQKIGVLGVGIDSEYFDVNYENLVNKSGNTIIIMNEDYEILLQSDQWAGEVIYQLNQQYPLKSNPNQEFYYENSKFISTIWNSEKEEIRVMNLIDMKIISDEAMRLLSPLFYTAILSIIVSIGFAVFTSNSISKNISILLKKIRATAKGDFTGEIQPTSYDEVGMIAFEVNEMAKKIQKLLEEITNEKLQKQQMNLKAVEFEYAALQAQINPHFLYNTLESINSLAKIYGDHETADAIYLLGNYLRESISNKRKFVTLREEIKNIHDYIRIQQISYGDKIEIRFQLDDVLMDAIVPKLILQPLVENAIVHGIEPKIGRGVIQISTRCNGNSMVIEISDDGVGISESLIEQGDIWKEKKSGKYAHTKVGLASVHKRIQILYGKDFGIKISSREKSGTKICVFMPIIFEGEEQEDVSRYNH